MGFLSIFPYTAAINTDFFDNVDKLFNEPEDIEDEEWFEDKGDEYVLNKKLLDEEIKSMKLEYNDKSGMLSLEVIYNAGTIELLSVNVPSDANTDTISAERNEDTNYIEIKAKKK